MTVRGVDGADPDRELDREPCSHDFQPVSPESLTLWCRKCRALSRPADDVASDDQELRPNDG